MKPVLEKSILILISENSRFPNFRHRLNEFQAKYFGYIIPVYELL